MSLPNTTAHPDRDNQILNQWQDGGTTDGIAFDMRAKLLRGCAVIGAVLANTKFGIQRIPLVTVWIAEMLPVRRRVI